MMQKIFFTEYALNAFILCYHSFIYLYYFQSKDSLLCLNASFFFSVPLRRETSAPREGNPNPMLRDKTSDIFYVKAQMQNLFGDNRH